MALKVAIGAGPEEKSAAKRPSQRLNLIKNIIDKYFFERYNII